MLCGCTNPVLRRAYVMCVCLLSMHTTAQYPCCLRSLSFSNLSIVSNGICSTFNFEEGARGSQVDAEGGGPPQRKAVDR